MEKATLNKKKIATIISVISGVFITLSLLFFVFSPEPLSLVGELVVSSNRPAEQYLLPEKSDSITDVRIFVRERDINTYWFMSTWASAVKPSAVYQLYYSYSLNGQRYDIPFENYDLKGVLTNFPKQGYDACVQSHVVDLGSHVLITYLTYGEYNSNSEFIVKVDDTLNTPIQEITEYYTPNNSKYFKDGARYCLFTDSIATTGSDNFEYGIWTGFPKIYCAVLNSNDLDEDYIISFTTHYLDDDNNEKTELETLTYQDIQEALNRE